MDPDGRKPTPLEATLMSQYAYEANRKTTKLIGGWAVYGIPFDCGTCNMIAFSRSIDGVTEYCVANAGSKTFGDWVENGLQPFGLGADIQLSMLYAEAFVIDHPGAEVTFVGHSKGGAEAAANAIATNMNAMLFNPAFIVNGNYGIDISSYTAEMTAFVVRGDILELVFGLITRPIDKIVYLPMQSWNPIVNHCNYVEAVR